MKIKKKHLRIVRFLGSYVVHPFFTLHPASVGLQVTRNHIQSNPHALNGWSTL